MGIFVITCSMGMYDDREVIPAMVLTKDTISTDQLDDICAILTARVEHSMVEAEENGISEFYFYDEETREKVRSAVQVFRNRLAVIPDVAEVILGLIYRDGRTPYPEGADEERKMAEMHWRGISYSGTVEFSWKCMSSLRSVDVREIFEGAQDGS